MTIRMNVIRTLMHKKNVSSLEAQFPYGVSSHPKENIYILDPSIEDKNRIQMRMQEKLKLESKLQGLLDKRLLLS